MALKKSDLYGSLWRSCDELRGGMDASQYKDYILTLLFVKYVSDKAKADPNNLIDVPTLGSFDAMTKLKGDPEIGDKMNKVIGRLAAANGLEKVIDLADFNDEEKLGKGKEMVDRLSKLVAIFADLDFRGSRAEGDDLLGDAYEYLMRHFATESGKSKGQFYTPAEVSRVVARVIGIGANTRQDQTVYDPTCGSGSLLLKVADEAPRGITIYGQEKDNATWALAKMNMILHSNADADIRKGDTITGPQFTTGTGLTTFDFAVANPPFSVKSWSNGLENDYGRFEFGQPPEKNGDYAFLLHILKSLKSTGKAAVILPHGVLFRGNAEATIRKQLLKRGYIKGIIGLPANLFYGTGIPACIVVLDKENAQARTGVFMIDASKGFMKDGPKNRLRARDIHKIVDVFTKQATVERYSRMVPMSEIADPKNDYNLNIPRYIDSSEPEDLQDLHAHLHGGIPNRDLDALNHYWDAFPSLRAGLFTPNRPGYSDLAVHVSQVQQVILDSAEFKTFAAKVQAMIGEWFEAHRATLEAINANTKPAELIAELSEDLLARFRPVPLLDEYDAYEQLMSYWQDTMHDDVFLIMNEGWEAAAKPRKAIEDKDSKLSETPDLVVGTGRTATKYKMDLVPPGLIVGSWFASEKDRIDRLNGDVEVAVMALDDHVQEHGLDEGLIAEATNDKGKYTQQLLNAAIRQARASHDEETLRCALDALALLQAEASAKKKAKEAQVALDQAILHKFQDLTGGDVQHLVQNEKWLASIENRISSDVVALALALASRVALLGKRYNLTLQELETTVADLSKGVAASIDQLDPARIVTTIRLRDIGSTYGGLTGKTKADFGRGSAHFVTFLEVINAPRLYGTRLESVDVGREEKQNKVLKGDLLFNGSSETPEEVALSAVVDYDPSPSTYLNSFCFGFRMKRRDVADPAYLAYLFRSRLGRNLVSVLAQGATRYNISKSKLVELEIPLPTLDSQRQIAMSLAKAEDLVASLNLLTEKRRCMGEGIAQALIQDHCEDRSRGVAL